MPRGKNSAAITAVVSKELKKKLQEYADSKHWSMSQAAAILIAQGLNQAESEETIKK